jgi:hypothetical protein
MQRVLMKTPCDVCSGRISAADFLFCWRQRHRLSYPVERLENAYHERPIRWVCDRCHQWAIEYRRSRVVLLVPAPSRVSDTTPAESPDVTSTRRPAHSR